MTDTAHVDIILRFPGGDYFVGHADVDATERSALRCRELATLFHQMAWGFEEQAELSERVEGE